MTELQKRLRRFAEEGARQARPPGAAAAVRRGRRRQLRLAGGSAVLVVLVLVAGMLGADRLASRPAPLAPAPPAGPPTTVGPPRPAEPLPVTPLHVQVHPGPFRGVDKGQLVAGGTGIVRHCGGGLTGKAEVRAWAKVDGLTWLLAAKPPPPGKQWVCWAHGLQTAAGDGGLALPGGPSVKPTPLRASPHGAGLSRGGVAVVAGTVTKRAARVQVLFHKARPLDLVPIEVGDRFPVNFYAGFYRQPAPPPSMMGAPEWAVDRVIAYDQAGRRVAECRAVFGPGNTC